MAETSYTVEMFRKITTSEKC